MMIITAPRIMLGLAALGLGYLLFAPSAKAASSTTPAPPTPPPPTPPPSPPSPPPIRSFRRLAIGNQPGSRTFAMQVGDVISVNGFAWSPDNPSGFTMGLERPEGMLGRIDASSGFGPVGPNDFVILAPGAIRVNFPATASETLVRVSA